MSPNELARQLARIASAIENSKNPSREMVTRDLRRVLANLDPMVAEENHEAAIGLKGGILSAVMSILVGAGCSPDPHNTENADVAAAAIASKVKSGAKPLEAAEATLKSVMDPEIFDHGPSTVNDGRTLLHDCAFKAEVGKMPVEKAIKVLGFCVGNLAVPDMAHHLEGSGGSLMIVPNK
jgi:hypothetical protein